MINSYARTVRANPLMALVGLGVTLVCMAVLVLADAATFLKLAGATIAFVFLVRRPELALAIQFNGIALYLYVVYKLSSETTSFMTGSFYTAVAAAYLAGGWHLARARKIISLSTIDRLFLLLYGIFFVSYLIFSLDNPAAYRKVAYAPVLVIAPYLGLQLLVTREQVQRFFIYCSMLTVITILPSVYELVTNPYFSEYGRFSIYTFADKSDNPIQFGISFSLLLLVILFRAAAQRRISLWQAALILPSVYFLVRSGARGPLISFVVALLFYIAWLGELRPRVKFGVLGGLSALLITAFSLIPDRTSYFYQALFNPEISPTLDPSANSIQERLMFIEMAIKEFLENPVIGVGTGNSVGGIGYPHNVWIEVAAEFGILGLLIFIALCVVVVRTAVKNLHNPLRGQTDWLMNLSFAIFIFAFVEALFSAYMGGDILFYGSMGMISVVSKLYEQEELSYQPANNSNDWLDRYLTRYGSVTNH